MLCVQCGTDFRRDDVAKGKRCRECLVANSRGACVDCGVEVERPEGARGFRSARCTACRSERKRQQVSAAVKRAWDDPDRAAAYRATAKANTARWREANPEKQRELDKAAQARRWADDETRLKMKMQRADRIYGLGPGGYLRLLEAQENRCAICRVEFTPDVRLAVDHDHRCCEGKGSCGSCVRGLLCAGCNLGLAAFRDDADRLRAALKYLS